MLKTRGEIQAAHDLAFREGISFRELGERYGMSHEGIRQAFIREGLSTNGRPTQHQRAEAEAQKRKEEIYVSYRRLGSLDRVAENVGLPVSVVGEVVMEMPLRNVFRRKGKAVGRTKDRIQVALRQAWIKAGRDKPLTTTAYARLAVKHHYPATATIKQHYGSFYEACRATGVRANPPRGPYDHAYTAADCIEGIRKCAAYLGHEPSIDEYQNWHWDKVLSGEAPSAATIRAVCGWAEAVIEALS